MRSIVHRIVESDQCQNGVSVLSSSYCRLRRFEATLLSGLRRMDEELSLLDMHTWQGGTDAWLDPWQVGLLLSWWDG